MPVTKRKPTASRFEALACAAVITSAGAPILADELPNFDVAEETLITRDLTPIRSNRARCWPLFSQAWPMTARLRPIMLPPST